LEFKLGKTSVNETQPAATGEIAPVAIERRWLHRSIVMLGLLAATHFLVDIVASTTNPIWPTLEENLQLNAGGLLWVYVAWSIATSFSQLLFGLWADRHHSRWLIWTGPCIAIICISCLGLVDSQFALAALYVVGGLGIAAFHPEAAATAGSLLPHQRTRAMAVFALCGYLGQSAGPFYSGIVTEQYGVRGLRIGIVWGLPILLLLYLGLRRAPSSHTLGSATRKLPADISSALKSEGGNKLGLIVLLLAVGALRILPALGVPLALAYILKADNASNELIGVMQSAFMAGIGVGAMACAAFVRRKWERTVLWVSPICSAPLLVGLAYVDGWTLATLVATCGLLVGVTMPLYISYGQQMLPHGQRVASAITMGVSWGIGGGIVAVALRVCLSFETLSSIFGFFAVSAILSGILCYALPTPDPRAD